MTFLKNAWYTIAWKNELVDGEMLSRKILNTSIVLHRAKDGAVKALRDVCPHRMAPLSKGKLEDGIIQCPYHGLKFNGDGQCVHNPHGEGHIPPRAVVQSFPVLEKYFAIWVWMGDPDKADAALLPEFEFMEEETHRAGSGYLKIEADYRLEIDNILDLSHIEFMHPIFASPAVSEGAVSYTRDEDRVWSHREMLNDAHLPDFLREAFQIPGDVKVVNRWLDVSWDAPALLAVHAYCSPLGVPKDVSRETTNGPSVHWFTPETENSTHYFFAFGQPIAHVGAEMAQEIANMQTQGGAGAFEFEDKPMIEAQAAVLEGRDLMEHDPIILETDAASVWARKSLSARIAAEQQAE